MKIISKNPVYQVVLEFEGVEWGEDYNTLHNWLDEYCTYYSFEEEKIISTIPRVTRLTMNIVEKEDGKKE